MVLPGGALEAEVFNSGESREGGGGGKPPSRKGPEIL